MITLMIRFLVHVDEAAMLSGLLYRFHRKYQTLRKGNENCLPLVLRPTFYTQSALAKINETLVQPIDSGGLTQYIGLNGPLWVYCDCIEGFYELHRPTSSALGRVRCISIAPPNSHEIDPVRVFKGQCPIKR